MSAWTQFVSTALVGTSQGQAPELPGPLPEIFPPAAGPGEREAAFLAAAGALSLWRRAGWLPPELTSVTPPAEAESRVAISGRNDHHLRRMAQGEFAAFLPE